MIQDIAPCKFDNHFQPGLAPGEEDTLFRFSGEKILCRPQEDGVRFPQVKDASDQDGLIYLFRIDEKAFYLSPEEGPLIRGDFEYHPVRSLRKRNVPNRPLIFAAVTARHLNDWYRSNRYCGCCGGPVRHAEQERALVCPACGNVIYPRINPAVIIGVTNGDRLLMTKYAGRNLPFYALVAGFTEIGESFEETVRREVMEEVGLQVTNIRYYKSQPWGFADDILAGYFCDVTGDPEIHMDTTELKEAVWMKREEIPGQPDDFSLTNEMMMVFRNGGDGHL